MYSINQYAPFLDSKSIIKTSNLLKHSNLNKIKLNNERKFIELYKVPLTSGKCYIICFLIIWTEDFSTLLRQNRSVYFIANYTVWTNLSVRGDTVVSEKTKTTRSITTVSNISWPNAPNTTFDNTIENLLQNSNMSFNEESSSNAERVSRPPESWYKSNCRPGRLLLRARADLQMSLWNDHWFKLLEFKLYWASSV